MSISNIETEPEILISRLIDAPREKVFAAWIDPAQLVRWHAPHGCTIHYERLDPHSGGGLHSCIRTASGYECWCVGDYLEITPPERLVYTLGFADPDGKRRTADEAGMPHGWPDVTTVTVTFEAEGAGTRLTLRQTVSLALATSTGAYPSWLEMLDRLNDSLKGAEQ